MATNDEVPDFLADSETEELLSEDEEKALWRRLCQTDVAGRRINFGNAGGDMYRLEATLERIFAILGYGVVAEIRGVAVQTPESTMMEEQDDISLEVRYFLLSDYAPPGFPAGGKGAIVLHSGLEECVLRNGDVFAYEGSPLDIGFIE